ncbi:hypothetical protein ATK74_2071 [Propionicimonas paludicola]|uniref:Uncharacterized protein n=2 Tax=Propionicimonas paludicola TaxID=185243 RepID=A0A2A9CT06_9ACTN|nr:hypothetical protein ATK74_2071 [Propionicimonas paludicola]
MISAMKVLSKVSLAIGIVAVLAAAGIMVWGVLDVWGNMQPKNSINPINPYPTLWLGFAIGIIGGFFTGLGLAGPRKAAAA